MLPLSLDYAQFQIYFQTPRPLLTSLESLESPEIVMSECTVLLGWKLGVRGVLDSGFSLCTVPTYYCRSKYFYSQHPQLWNLIRTEHSLNRGEHRAKNKAS